MSNSVSKLLAISLAAAVIPAAPAIAATELITNGDFSANDAGWTVSSNAFFFDGAYREGNIGDVGSISQIFAATPGSLLTLSFDYSGDDGYQFVDFNGSTVAGSLVNNPSALQSYTFNLGSALASNTLTFFGRNDPSFNSLDNVSVLGAVPEPATWLMMIVGFGLVGGALRRNRQQTNVRFGF